MMTRNDIENSKREACERAKAEGAKQKQREVAKKMKADGLSSDVIQKYTGLTPEEIQSL